MSAPEGSAAASSVEMAEEVELSLLAAPWIMLLESLYSFSTVCTSWLVRSPCSSPSTLRLKVPSLA